MDLWNSEAIDVTAFLRELAQGEGLTLDGTEAALKAAGYQETDRIKLEETINQITSASELIVNREHREAIRNALGITGQGDTLTERRMGYLTNVDISLRTLQRHEEKGAEAIAELLPRVAQSTNAGLDYLIERLDDIEAMLLRLLYPDMSKGGYFRRDVETREMREIQEAAPAEWSDASLRALRRAVARHNPSSEG